LTQTFFIQYFSLAVRRRTIHCGKDARRTHCYRDSDFTGGWWSAPLQSPFDPTS
jgi:hypothetical protein